MMEQSDLEQAINQLVAAAELLAGNAAVDGQLNAHQMRAFFRLQQQRFAEPSRTRTTDDELFKSTASAALSMAGRKEYLAAAALLEQARSLLPD